MGSHAKQAYPQINLTPLNKRFRTQTGCLLHVMFTSFRYDPFWYLHEWDARSFLSKIFNAEMTTRTRCRILISITFSIYRLKSAKEVLNIRKLQEEEPRVRGYECGVQVQVRTSMEVTGDVWDSLQATRLPKFTELLHKLSLAPSQCLQQVRRDGHSFRMPPLSRAHINREVRQHLDKWALLKEWFWCWLIVECLL